MKAFGLRKHDDLVEGGLGAPSKHWRNSSKKRTTGRRLLHKQGRNDNRKEILRATNDWPFFEV